MRELMRRRYVYGESKPYDAEVEYVQTSGQQIIRINCSPVIFTDVVFKFVNDTTQQRLYCAGTSSIKGFNLYINANRKICATANSDWGEGISFTWSAKCRVRQFGSERYSVVNNLDTGAVKAITHTGFTKLSNLILFKDGLNNYPTAKARLYNGRFICENGRIIDLISVRIGEQGALYDRSNGEIYMTPTPLFAGPDIGILPTT